MSQLSMIEINGIYKKIIEEDFEQSKSGMVPFLKYIANTIEKKEEGITYSLYAPKLFTEDSILYLKKSMETMHRILIKVMKEYAENEQYRKHFGFSKDMENLILIPPNYTNILPLTRLDIFLNEEDMSFKYCEFNADGSSCMNEDRELNNALKFTQTYKKFTHKYDIIPFELFDSWVDEVMNIYDTYYKKTKKPFVAIVDFLEKLSSIEEVDEFARRFKNKGIEAEVCEIRDLKYIDGGLYTTDGRKIDVIYRRAVTCDVMENISEVGDFISAIRDGNVCVLGSFCTQIIHDKIIFKVLHMEETHKFLTDEEVKHIKGHIPFTSRLDESEISISDVIKNKDKWVIKPEDSYGARGVYAGVDFQEEKWRELVENSINKTYMVQEFCLPYATENLDYYDGDNNFKPYNNLTGIYVYNGKFAGIYSRQSKNTIISAEIGECDIASAMVKFKG